MDIGQKKVGVILSYASLLISIVVDIINVPLFLNFIGVGEYGVYQTIGSLIAYFSILDFGLPATIVVFYSRYRASGDKTSMDNVLAICSRMYIAITAAILSVGIALYFSLDSIYSYSLTAQQLSSAKQIYVIFLVNIAITLPFQIFNAIITAHERFAFLKGTTILITVLQALVIMITLYKFRCALSIVVVQTVFNIATALIRYFYCSEVLKIKIKMHFFDRKLFKSIVKYSFFIFLNVIVDQLFWRINMIILSIVGNSASVAAYSITFKIAYNYMILSSAITGVFLPSITAMVLKGAKNKELSDIFIRVGRIQFILLSCVVTGFILFGRQFISLWCAGKTGFEDSYLMTLIIILPLTIDLVQGLAQTILQAVNKFWFRVIVFLFINVISIALTVPAARVYGGIGCAAISGGSFLILVLILNIFYAKHLNFDMRLFWKQILAMLVPVVLCLAAGFIINYVRWGGSILNLGIKILLYVILYFGVMWGFAMNRYEKNLLIKLLGRAKSALTTHKNKT